MATFTFRVMVIEFVHKSTGIVSGKVINAEDLPPNKVESMNKNLEVVIDQYTPEPGSFSTSATNAIALWIVKGLGEDAEIIEYGTVNHDPDVIY